MAVVALAATTFGAINVGNADRNMNLASRHKFVARPVTLDYSR